ncbi:hypothetical protein H8711_05870 [Clostridiaceae bacterium NSJ-31]|uniref:Uncharacterized protein n=1 Tax=Ligaoa zhengdingensis TaxID=2763658 RepID=A0A926DWB4_9FIRM|nr:hypothetical protein [Ligaoa zhengdingensis]MBC8546460.1 hypothetical protein [Ligaoa zhengdingensis]
MNLNQQSVQAARAALQSMWGDICEIWRATKAGNVKKETRRYAGVRCHLSTKTLPQLTQDNAGATATQYMVYFDPAQDVTEGDTLRLVHKGRKYLCIVGRVHEYNVNKVAPVEVVEIA